MTVGRIPSVEGGIQPTIVDAKGDLIAAVAADSLNRLAVGSNDQVLVADSTASTGLAWKSNGAPFAAGKNKFINGDMRFWQRGTTATLTTGSAQFLSDRWKCRCDFTAGTASISQQTFTPGTAPVAGYEGTFFNRVTCGSTSTYSNLQQPIEDVRTLAGQTVTFSIWAKSSAATSLTFTAYQSFGTGGSGVVTISGGTTYTTTTSWTRYTWTVSVPSVSGKTIGANSLLDCYFEFSGTLGSVTCDTWGAQAEASSVATPFQTATGTIQGELAACQRYYQVIAGTIAGSNFPIVTGYASAVSQTPRFPVSFPVTMRVTPTMTKSGTWNLSNCTGPNTNPFIGPSGFTIEVTTTAAAVYYAYADSTDDKFTFSSEL